MKAGTPTAEIVGTGRALPERVMTKLELDRMVDTESFHPSTGDAAP